MTLPRISLKSISAWVCDQLPKQRERGLMTTRAWLISIPALLLAGCGGSSSSPTTPSAPASFLTGTWRGTLVLQVNPGDPTAPAASSGTMEWTFEATPQSNLQSFRASIRADHPWLGITTDGTTTITPGNTAPADIATHGEFSSPRGCRGTFGSVGRAGVTRIDADFTGTDCMSATFAGTISLVKVP